MISGLLRQPWRRLVGTALLLGMALAHAAGGFTITRDQEALVKSGMTQDQVQQALGPPARNVKFAKSPGPTWIYNLAGALDPVIYFDVDFGYDGRVLTARERVLFAR